MWVHTHRSDSDVVESLSSDHSEEERKKTHDSFAITKDIDRLDSTSSDHQSGDDD